MKDLFPQYAERDSFDFEKIWKEALFVFDTNFLLNIYRYQQGAREELLQILEKISERIWIPHHVALEFQRNRITVIAEQHTLHTEARKAIDEGVKGLRNKLEGLNLKKRHSAINLDEILTRLDVFNTAVQAELNKSEDSLQGLTARDELKAKIEALFDGRVGNKPENQQQVNEIYDVAKKRFEKKTPPGYKDGKKEEDSKKKESGFSEYMHANISYKKEYGDYLIWVQILEFVKSEGKKSVILITNDNKEDWWQKIEAKGLQTIGPRPELIDEIRTVGNVENFLMYNSENFLKNAKDYLAANVSDSTLTEAREISAANYHYLLAPSDFSFAPADNRLAVMRWIEKTYGYPTSTLDSEPVDFVVEREDVRIGFEIYEFQRASELIKQLNASMLKFREAMEIEEFTEMCLVIIVRSPDIALNFFKFTSSLRMGHASTGLRLVFGICEKRSSGMVEFIPVAETI